MATAQTNMPLVPTESLDAKFHRLADEWQNAVAHHSSSSKRDNHPTYQEIIALGDAVVPILLRDLEKSQRHWFTALTAITGANPIKAEEAGNIPKMIDAWLKWGRDKGYEW